MNNYTNTNRLNWNERVALHVTSEFYDLDTFKAGGSSLKSLECEELGDVSGKALLHLQCHFGMDTLSWARSGAIVTGVDFSEQAITQAKALALEQNLNARFVACDIYELPRYLTGEFDIVFTSYGVLCWLGDLSRWAQIIASFLKPGGRFYIVDSHPTGNLFDEESKGTFSVRYSYFNIGPERYESDVSYTDSASKLNNTVTYEWSHSLGEIVNAVLEAGLQLQFLHEFPFEGYQKLPWMEQGTDGWWRLPNGDTRIPFLFSLMAIRAPIP